MLHVVSPPSSLPQLQARNPFDPIAYLAHCRKLGMVVRGSFHGGVRRLSWDIGDALGTRKSADARLDIDADPDNSHLVWETLRAEAYIDAARECRLIIYPWLSPGPGIGMFGQEHDGPNDFDSGLQRLVLHPDGQPNKDCRRGLIFRVLCADFCVDPDDPQLCWKVNAELEATYARVAS